MRIRHLLPLVAVAIAGCSTPDPYTGQPFATNRKVLVRPATPSADELRAKPPVPYDVELRARDAEILRLTVPRDVHDKGRWLEEGGNAMRAAMGPSYGPRHDPWESFEDDRRRVIVHEWADVGKPAATEPEEGKKEPRPLEDDPFAPVAKPTPKKEPGAADPEKPAEGEGDKGDKKMEGEKKGE